MRLTRSACFALALFAAGRALGASAYDTLGLRHNQWKSHHPARYAYTYHVATAGPGGYGPPTWKVEAAGDSVVKVTKKFGAPDVQPNPDPQFYSIDSLFARIRATLDSNPDQHAIRYDSALGYPEAAYFYPDTTMMDAGFTYQISDFTDLVLAAAEDSLAANRAKWKAHRPHRFSYTYWYSCFCFDSPRWIVEVRDDSVVEVKNGKPGGLTAPGGDLQRFHPDSLFAAIKAGLDLRDPLIYVTP